MAIAEGGDISDLMDLKEALDLAKEALEKIKQLEDKEKSCSDATQKIEIEKRISNIRQDYSGRIAKAASLGSRFTITVAIAGAICAALPEP